MVTVLFVESNFMLMVKDEVNPNIVYNYNRNVFTHLESNVKSDYESARCMSSSENASYYKDKYNTTLEISRFANKFDNLYNEAYNFARSSEIGNKFIDIFNKVLGLKDFMPIAFGATPVLEKLEKDNYSVPKFGGFPNYDFTYHKDPVGNYPRCRNCHNYMKFLFQMNSNLIDCLHYLTCKPLRFNQSVSPYGYGRALESFLRLDSQRVFYAFYCKCAGSDNCNLWGDFCLFSNYTMGSNEKRDESKQELLNQFMIDNKLMDDENSMRIVDFVPFVDMESIPFDLDESILSDEEYDDFQELFTEKFKYNDGFFGVPHSQQSPKRPFSNFQFYDEGNWSLGRSKRMVPFYNWSDSEQDMTHQAYIDLQDISSIGYTRGILDSSCT